MPSRKKSPTGRRPGGSVQGLAQRPPLALDPQAVAAEGIIRVALDTVAADPAVVRLTAEATTPEAKVALQRARADLARRSAAAYVTSVATFTRPDALPKF